MTIQLTPGAPDLAYTLRQSKYDQSIANASAELIDYEYVGKLHNELLSFVFPKLAASGLVSFSKMERLAHDLCIGHLSSEYSNNIDLQSFAYGFDTRKQMLPMPQHSSNIDVYTNFIMERAEDLSFYNYDPTIALDLIRAGNTNLSYSEYMDRLNRMLKNIYNPRINSITYIISSCALYVAKNAADLWANPGKTTQPNHTNAPGYMLSAGIAGAIGGAIDSILEDTHHRREIRWNDAGAWALGGAAGGSLAAPIGKLIKVWM